MRPRADSRDAVHSAQGVNSPADLQRFDGASIGLGREGILEDSGYQDPTTCAVVTGCTTTRCKPHGTEVDICYRWHPWYGRTVQVVRSIAKQPGTVLQVCDGLKPERSLEIPVWMADSAICALMKFSKVPAVDAQALSALADLLDRRLYRHEEGVLESRHLSFSTQGDTDATKTTRKRSVATRSTATTTNDTRMGRTATAGQGRRAGVAGAAAKGAPHRLRRTGKPKGGGR